MDVASSSVASEEVLEELWTAHESGGQCTIAELERSIHAGPSAGWRAVVAALVTDALVTSDGEVLALTPQGAERAREVVRRHRLAEVLFFQVLELPMEETESEACRIEHVLSSHATDAVCSFLGHPPVCPHGRAIPPGACCAALTQKVKPLISRLADLNPGERGRVVLVAPHHRERLDQLTDLGVMPGAVLTLRQRRPSVVVEVDRTLLALEDGIASGIFVRPLLEW